MCIIQLTPDQEQKYVVVLVENAGRTEVCLWGDPAAEWHNDIVQNSKEKGIVVQSVLGGGKILMLPEQKQIYVWGASSRFGKADVAQLRGILTEHVPEYEIRNGEPGE